MTGSRRSRDAALGGKRSLFTAPASWTGCWPPTRTSRRQARLTHRWLGPARPRRSSSTRRS